MIRLFLLLMLYASSAWAYNQNVTITVGPPTGPQNVINANNPVSAATLMDGYGATWSFDKTAALSPECTALGAPDCEGNWPVLRNGTADNIPLVVYNFRTNAGAFQLMTVPGDSHMYGYDNYNNLWYQADASGAWSPYMRNSFGSAPPGPATTAVPVLLDMNAWSFGGMTPFNTSFMNRLPDALQGGGTAPYIGTPQYSAFIDSNMPNIPLGTGYLIAATTVDGVKGWPPPWNLYTLTISGNSGDSFFTMSAPFTHTAVAGWFLFFPPAGIQGATHVTSFSNGGLTANIDKPLTGSFTNQTVYLQAMIDYPGITAGNYDDEIISSIRSYLLPYIMYISKIRIDPEWCCTWETHSPFTGYGESTPVYTPAQWSPAVAHVAILLKQLLVTCGTGCNPNVKIGLDGPFDDLQASYFTYTNPSTEPVPLAELLDDYDPDGYFTTNQAWDPKQGWMNYCCMGSGTRGFVSTFAQKWNKPIEWTEFCDMSYMPARTTIFIWTQMVNWMASIQGPGNAKFVELGDFNTDNGGPMCYLGDHPNKMAAIAQPWPDGFGGTHYDGSHFTVPAMPLKNPWDPTHSNHIPTGISLSPTSATVSHTIVGGTGFSQATFTTSDGQPIYEGITTSDNTLFGVGLDPDSTLWPGASLLSGAMVLYAGRNYTSADIGVHTTNVCSQVVPAICATFTLTVN